MSPVTSEPISKTPRRVRVAVIGCGAVARESLLPVLAGHEGVALGPLVDRDERRARELANAYGVASVLTDMNALSKDVVDAVVLATPPAHHAPGALSLIGKGLHVLVEKPMAITAADARAMVDAAERAKVTISVGLYRRFLPSVQLLRALVERREFGRIVSVDAEEGGPYGWPLATLDGLRRSSGGGGTLIDLGSHVIDLVLFAVRGTPILESYADNERGGIETDCVLRASLDTPHGRVPFRLEMSRTRELRGTVRIVCEHATLELPRASFTDVLVKPPQTATGAPIRYSAAWQGQGDFSGFEAFRLEMDDWITGITQGTEPVLSGRSVVPVVTLIEDAYRVRTPLKEPGDELAPSITSGSRKRVLVTGAGGFLGGRTVELLRDRYGWDAVPLVREPKSAARLARWPYEILLGDVTSPEDMDRAMKGFDAVVHCAVGTHWKPEESRRVTVDGTRIAAEAALKAGVKRFIHISSLFVHKRDGVDRIDERVVLEPGAANDYGLAKLAAEQALAAVASRGLSTIILRPTRIYGPYSRTFTVRPLQALSEGRLAIRGRADIPGNMVYVDNVVTAIQQALNAPDSAKGSAYLITDLEQLTLLDFYDYFARPHGLKLVLVPEPLDEAAAVSKGFVSRLAGGVLGIAKSSEFRGIVRRVLDTDPIGTLPRRLWDRSPRMQEKMLRAFGSDPAVVYRRAAAGGADLLEYYGESALVLSAKAQTELGYVPLAQSEAMARTLVWARYARLLPALEEHAVESRSGVAESPA
jgi:predicted dehydrogenase/nucleoside-diphosphate-sugar epimerase